MSRCAVYTLPSLAARLAYGRPVLAQAQVIDLTKRILAFSTTDTCEVIVGHTARVVTRIANGQVLFGADGDILSVEVHSKHGRSGAAWIDTNQLDDTVLRAIVHEAESIARSTLVGCALASSRLAVRMAPATAAEEVARKWRRVVMG